MRFVRYGAIGAEKPGLLDGDGQLRDLSHVINDLSGPVLENLADLPTDGAVVPGTPRLGPPVGGIGKIVCIGQNYLKHAQELGNEAPPEPMIFMKALSSIAGPFDPFPLPKYAKSVDWEVELGIVIGTAAKYVDEADAMKHVAGFMAINDISERDWQRKRAGQFTKGKSGDGFAPLGPWLVTPDEVGDPQVLGLRLIVNGAIKQDGNTDDMIFGVTHLVSYLSQFFTLHPGDVIATGTPSGVGAGRKPPEFLAVGDVMRLEIDHLGAQEIEVVAEQAGKKQ